MDRVRMGAIAAAGMLVLAACGVPTDGSAVADPGAVVTSDSEESMTSSEPEPEPEPEVVETEPTEDEVTTAAVPESEPDCAETDAWDVGALHGGLDYGSAITAVQGAVDDCYESFSVQLESPAVLPGYVVEYVPELTEDGSGFVVPVAGAAILQVMVVSPSYDMDEGTMTWELEDDATTVVDPGYAMIQQVTYAGSFEGQSRFGIGLDAPRPFTVETATDGDGNTFLTVKVSAVAEAADDASGDVPAAAHCGGIDEADASAKAVGDQLGGSIIGVEATAAGCFDSVTFLIEPTDAEPGYRVEYVPAVIQDGSGFEVPVAGTAALQVTVLSPAYDFEDGTATLIMDDPENVVDASGLDVIEQIAFGGSFEGQTVFGIGVSAELPFNVESGITDDGYQVVIVKVATG